MFSAPFPFRKAVTKVLPLFLTAKFFANFFQVSFPEPRVRAGPTPSGITPKLYDHRSVSLLRLQRYCLLPFPPNFSASFLPLFSTFFTITNLSTSYKNKKNRWSFIKNASDSFYFQNLVHIMQVVPHSVLLSVKVKSIIFIRFDFQWNIFLYRQSIPRKSDSFLRIVCEQSHL